MTRFPAVEFRKSLGFDLRSSFLLNLTFGLLLTLGCSPESGSPASTDSSANETKKTVSKTGGPALKDVENADYVSWSQFPLGTKVVRRKTMSNDVGTTVITTTLELKEINAEKLIVESQITVQRTNDTTENPPSALEYPKSQKIPDEMDAELFSRPLPDAQKVSTESIQSFGKNYEATIYEWKAQLESGPMKVKGWFSDQFPGRQIKLEFENPSGNEPFVEEVIELNIPKS